MNKFNISHYFFFLSSLFIHLVFFIIAFNIDSLHISDDNIQVPILIDITSIKQSSAKHTTYSKATVSSQPKKIQKTDTSILEPQSNEQKSNLGESEIGLDLNRGHTPLNEKEKYLVLLRDKINKFQSYPRHSKLFKEEGLVKIRMTLDREGQLTKLELIQATKYSRLNDAAMKAASDAAPFFKFPNDVEYQNWKIIVPIRFML